MARTRPLRFGVQLAVATSPADWAAQARRAEDTCIGTVEQICEDLPARRERWDASCFVPLGDRTERPAPVVAALRGS